MENNENMLLEMARMRELIKFDYVINEQRHRKIIIKTGKEHVLWNKPSEKASVNFDNYNPITPEAQWDEYLKGDKKMVSLMANGSWRKNWEKLKSDAIHKGYAVAALEKFNETYPEKKWKSVLVGDTKTIDEVPVDNEGDTLPGVAFKLPGNLPPNSRFFIDNYFQLTDVFIQSVKVDIIDPIVIQMKELNPPEGQPKAFIDLMKVVSSCSTLPNGESPDGNTYSFVDLSRLRNQTATEYVLKELRRIGVFIPEEFKPEQNWMGTNAKKPGTSGPDWNSNWDDKIKAQKRPEYEKYKYLDIELLVGFNDTSKPIDEPDSEDCIEVISDIYSVKFSKPGRYKSFQLKWPVLKTTGSKKRKPITQNQRVKCPTGFKGSKKGFWKDPKLGYN